MKKLITAGVTCLTFFIVVHQASAATVSLGAQKDNTLFENSTGSLSNGAGQYFFTGRTAQGAGNDIRRGLIAFDIAGSVPAGATINSVRLTLNMSRSISGPQNVGLHQVLSDWGEGTSNAPGQEGAGTAATPSDATWLHTFSDTSLWSLPGGDFADVASGTQSIAGNGFYTWDSTADIVADVQLWLDNPTFNSGWLLLGDEATVANAKRFDTREHPTASVRPVLEIDFTPIPEPTTLSMVTLGLLTFARRRRRAAQARCRYMPLC